MITHLNRLIAKGKSTLQADIDLQMAMAHYAQLMAQSTIRLSEALIQAHPQIDWVNIRGFRNRLVHDYLGFDFELVWTILVNELPTLQKAIDTILANFDATH